MEYFGNKTILKHHKTGFLSSRKCPADVVLKSYEWAKKQREEGICVVCGNHSQIEKDVFEILLKGSQSLVLVLPRGLKTRWPKQWLEEIEKNRLLIISPFSKEIKRVTRETAIEKNKTIIELSSEIVVGYSTYGGQLDELLKNKTYNHI
jgi:predicted Rossmann fold nucleotide-binding protein DprA/Smf involved in DNA uptake